MATAAPPEVPSSASAPPGGATAPDAVAIVLNGQAAVVQPTDRVVDLLLRLGLRRDGVAVAINGEVVPRSTWPARALGAGDRVEVIQAVGGG